MTDIPKVLEALEDEEAIIEYMADKYPVHTLDALIDGEHKFDAGKVLDFVDAHAKDAIVKHVVENYAEELAPHARKMTEEVDGCVVFELEELRKALRFGDLKMLVIKELQNRGVFP